MLTSGDIKDSFPKAKIKNGAEAMVAETETENSWMTASPHFPNQPSLSRIQISIFWENSSMPAQEENDKRNDSPTADVGEKNKMIEALSNKFLSLFVFLPERIADAEAMAIIEARTAEGVNPTMAVNDTRHIPKLKMQLFFDIFINLKKNIKNVDIIEI